LQGRLETEGKKVSENGHAQTELKQLHANLQNREQALEELQRAIHIINDQLATEKEKVSATEHEKEELNKEAEKLQQDFKRFFSSILTLSPFFFFVNLFSFLFRIKMSNAEIIKEKEELQTTLSHQIGLLEQGNKDLTAKLTSSLALAKTYEDNISELDIEKSSLESKLADLSKEVVQLKDQNTSHEREFLV
jgi:chromosome segregation ATPase